jgi:predicted nucleic-acid-binding protein
MLDANVVLRYLLNDDATTRDAVARYANVNADFVGCALAAAGGATGLPVVTFDRDFRKFGDMLVRLPREIMAEIAPSGGERVTSS